MILNASGSQAQKLLEQLNNVISACELFIYYNIVFSYKLVINYIISIVFIELLIY